MHAPEPEPVNAQSLLAEGRALRALARGLLGSADADDLVQEGYAVALATPVAHRRRLGPWLSGTVRHLASMLRRTERRRCARERLAARDEADADGDPARIAAQAEVIHEVAAAVRALDEPFRAAIVLRFWHGLLPEAIAQRLGVPRNTVRSRLQRGLERLRARLDGVHGNRERWSAPLLAVAGTEEAAVAAGVATAGASLLTVGLLMKTKLLLAAAAVLVAAVSVPLLWPAGPAATVVAAAPPSPPPAVASAAEPTAETPATSGRELVPPAAPAAPPDPPFDSSPVLVPPWLAQFVVVDEDERPVREAVITVWAAKRSKAAPRLEQLLAGGGKGNSYSGHDPQQLLELRTDAQGRASATLELECLYAAASKERMRAGEVMLWHTRSAHVETRFVLEMPIVLRGTVVRADGAPGAGALVIVSPNGGSSLERGQPPEPEPVVAAADGRFEVPVSRGAGYNLRAEANGQQSFTEFRRIRHAHPPEVVLAFPGGITLDGIVLDPDRQPVAGAKVAIWRQYHLDDPKQDPDDYEQHSVTSGPDGRFSVAVRRHARYQLLATVDGRAASELVWAEPTAVQPHAGVHLQLQRLATIDGVVQHADGSPFAGVRVLARPDTGREFPSVVGPSQGERFPLPPSAELCTSKQDGRFELTVHPGTTWSIVAYPVADNPLLTVVTKGVDPGRKGLVIAITDDERAGCLVAGSVVLAANGQPLHDFEVGIVRYDEQGKPSGATPSKPKLEGNRFELPPLPLGRTIAIQVTPTEPGTEGRGRPHAPMRLGPFVTSRAGLDLQVRIDAWGELPVRVVTAEGAPARRARVMAVRDLQLDSVPSRMPVDAEGRLVLKCTPGAHKLTVWRDFDKLLEQDVTILPGRAPEVVLRLPAPAAATGR